MATTIQVKRTTTANLPSTLEQGELAYIYDTSAADTDAGGNGGRLFIGDPTSNSNTPLKVGGKYYTDLMDHTLGTVTASKALLVDSNKKLNELLVDNITIDANTISSTNSNGDIIIDPNGTGNVKVGNFEFNADQTVGSGQDNYVLVYDHSSTSISLEAAASSSFTLSADSGSNDTFSTGGTLTFDGGTGIDTTVSDDQISFAIDSTVATLGGAQVLSNKTITNPILTPTATTAGKIEFLEGTNNGTNKVTLIGPASTADVTVTLPAAADTLVGKATTDTLTNKTINASNNTLSNIANASLANSSITVSDGSTTTATALGGTITFAAGEGMDVGESSGTITYSGEDATTSNKGVASFSSDNFAVSSGAVTIKDGGVANAELAGSIANSKLANSSITVSDGSNTTATALGGTITFSGTANEVTVAESSGTITVGLPNDVTIGNDLVVTGDFTVNGDTTTIATTNKVLTDTLIELANGTTGTPSHDAGIVIERGSAANAFIGFDESADKFIVGTGTFTGATTGNLSITTGTLVANLEATTATLGGADIVSVSASQTLTNKTLTTPTLTTPIANAGIQLKNGATSAGFLEFFEDSDNGTNKVTLIGPAATGDVTVVLPAAADTLVGKATTDTLTNKTINGPDNTLTNIANASLANSSITVSDGSNTTARALGTTITFASGEGIDATESGGTITIAGELATTSNKGVASFSSDNFTVSSGAVTVTTVDGGTYS